MMHITAHPLRRWLALFAVLVLFITSMPTPSAHAISSPMQGIAWALSVDFAANQPHVVYTTYIMDTNSTPPVILSSSQEDISANCTVSGALSYQNGYAVFDGNSYIICPLASWRDKLALLNPSAPYLDPAVSCSAGVGPMFAATQVKLQGLMAANTIVDAHGLGMLFSVPSDGSKALTQIQLSSGSYRSPSWTLNANGNRVLSGWNGPAIVVADTEFMLLDFLNPAWQSYFEANVTGAQIGHWSEPPTKSALRPLGGSYELSTLGGTIYIGRNNLTGTNFRGQIAEIVVDPGCKGN